MGLVGVPAAVGWVHFNGEVVGSVPGVFGFPGQGQCPPGGGVGVFGGAVQVHPGQSWLYPGVGCQCGEPGGRLVTFHGFRVHPVVRVGGSGAERFVGGVSHRVVLLPSR